MKYFFNGFNYDNGWRYKTYSDSFNKDENFETL